MRATSSGSRALAIDVRAGPATAHVDRVLVAIGRSFTVSELLQMPFYHPTSEEGLRTALRQLHDALPSAGRSDLVRCVG
jgi:dihydrolipoamide dehydrogenase